MKSTTPRVEAPRNRKRKDPETGLALIDIG
jgi:hypothetical protein